MVESVMMSINMNLQENIRRILREETYSPAGDEHTPGRYVVHKSPPQWRKNIKLTGLQVSVGECYENHAMGLYGEWYTECQPAIFATEQDHFIRTYSSARRAAKGERLITKMKPSGKRTPSGMTKLKTAPSGESVRRVKDLKKQMTKSGASKTGRVHTVDIMHRDSDVGKNDPDRQMERGRNFIQAVKDTPKHLEKAGAKKGDTVIGKPTAVMPGEDKKTGEAKRAKLYGKIFGKKSTKASPKTGLMTGKV